MESVSADVGSFDAGLKMQSGTVIRGRSVFECLQTTSKMPVPSYRTSKSGITIRSCPFVLYRVSDISGWVWDEVSEIARDTTRDERSRLSLLLPLTVARMTWPTSFKVGGFRAN